MTEKRELKYCERCGSLWLRPAARPKPTSRPAAPDQAQPVTSDSICPVCSSPKTTATWRKVSHKSSRRQP